MKLLLTQTISQIHYNCAI